MSSLPLGPYRRVAGNLKRPRAAQRVNESVVFFSSSPYSAIPPFLCRRPAPTSRMADGGPLMTIHEQAQVPQRSTVDSSISPGGHLALQRARSRSRNAPIVHGMPVISDGPALPGMPQLPKLVQPRDMPVVPVGQQVPASRRILNSLDADQALRTEELKPVLVVAVPDPKLRRARFLRRAALFLLMCLAMFTLGWYARDVWGVMLASLPRTKSGAAPVLAMKQMKRNRLQREVVELCRRLGKTGSLLLLGDAAWMIYAAHALSRFAPLLVL